jgi:cysteine synthase A
MVKVPDEAAFATLHFLKEIMNRRIGGSTGTNLYAAFLKIHEMKAKGIKGSVVSMICDSGERYIDTYYNQDWLLEHGYTEKMRPFRDELENFYKTGIMSSVA